MDSRKSKRFMLSDGLNEAASAIYIEFDIDTDESVKAGIFDISLGGVAVEISTVTDVQISKIESLDDFFIRLHCRTNMFIIGVEPVWRSFKRHDSGSIFKGGFKYDLISEGDRLKLADLIEELRASEILL